ncbi:hypothetical protein B0H16DRAFT_1879370 [Mycena metata]|uniref:Uncharacterized protein n=1 Tax=Mycena metata TaxID=1033252 RepID=A0AAD7NV51_9AGAR|nr:hypothetical protein B0H16DRAFT_1879370 [Mycena metata]
MTTAPTLSFSLSAPMSTTSDPFNQSLCDLALWRASDLLSQALSNPDLSGTFNPDVLGYGVRLSNFIINICAVIVICWGSQEDIAEALRSTLLQIGAIVLCTLISLIRGQLYFLDGYFTLLVVHSPIAWYIVWINLRQIYLWYKGRKDKANREEENLKADKYIPFNPLLCFTLVGGWLALNLVVWFKGRNFPGEECPPLSFKHYVGVVLLPQLFPVGFVPFTVSYVLVVCAFGSCIFRYRKQAAQIAQTTPSEWKKFSICVPFIFQHHKWPIYLLVVISYVMWVLQLSLFEVEPGFVFTYGQSLSVVAAATGSIPVIKLLWKARKLTKTDLARILWALISDIVFCFGPSRINQRASGTRSRLTLPPYDEDWAKLWSPSLPMTNLPSPQPPIASRSPTQTDPAMLRTNTGPVQGDAPGDGAAQPQTNTHTPNPPHSEDPILSPVPAHPQLAPLGSDVAQDPDTSVPAHGAVESLNNGAEIIQSISSAEDEVTPSALALPTTFKSDPNPPGEGNSGAIVSVHEERDIGPIEPSNMSAEIQAKSSGRAEDARRPRHRTTYDTNTSPAS